MTSKNRTDFSDYLLIVEGRDDTKRLKQFFPEIQTIETNGSALSEATLALIKKAATTREIVILTDPDFNGEQIRQKILAVVPDAKQAFLKREDAIPQKHHGSLGVEHASKETLLQLLQTVRLSPVAHAVIPNEVLAKLGLTIGAGARKRREQVGARLGIGYTNAKHFAERLRLMGITMAELKVAVKEVDEKNDK